MSVRQNSGAETESGGAQVPEIRPSRVRPDPLLAQNCRDAFERLIATTARDSDRLTRDSLAIQNVIDGTGFKTAGIARFSDDQQTLTVSFQCKTRMLEETTVLDVSEVTCVETVLAGLPAIITDATDEIAEQDALMRELSCTSFYAEPMGETDDAITGFLFAAHDGPMISGGLALRTFLTSVATWLLKGEHRYGSPGRASENGAGRTPTGLLTDILQQMGLGIIVFDANLKIMAVNDQTHGLLDVPETVLRPGSSMEDLIKFFGIRGDYGAEDAEQQIAHMREVVARRAVHSFDRHLQGGRIIACKARPRGDLYVVTYTDATEIYAHERERLENEKLLSETLDHMEQGLIVFDGGLEVVSVNRQTNEMLDVPDDILHVSSNMRAFLDFCAHRGDYGHGDAETLKNELVAMLQQAQAYTIERQFANGNTIVCTGRPRSGGGYILTYTDVTQWRQSERELDTKTELLSVALDYMDQGLVVYDANLMIEAFNDQVQQLLGVPDHALQVGSSMMILIEVWIKQAMGDAEGVTDEVETVQALASGGEDFSFERQLQGDRTVLCSGRLRQNGGYVLTISDVTRSKRQKRELAEKTSMLEAIVQHMDQGLLAFDRDLKLLFANERAKMMLGVARELFEPGRSFEKIVRKGVDRNGDRDAGDDAAVDQMLTQLHGTEPFSYERKCTANTTALVRFHPRPQGGYIVTYTDITASRRQQDELSDMADALRQKGVQLDKVFNNMANGVAMFDANTDLVICNPQYAEVFRLTEEHSTPGVSLADMCRYSVEAGNEADRETLVAGRVALAKSREPKRFNMNMVDGRIIHAIHEPLEDGGSIAVYEDVTIRESAEQKLREYALDLEHQKSVFQTVMENMDQGISLVDGDLVIQTFNSRFLELLEFPEDQFQPGDALEKFFYFNAARGEYGPGNPDQQVRERIDLASKFEPHCFVRERPDGTAIKIEGMPLPNGSGFVTTYTDVTETRQSELEINGLAERLTETNLRLDAAFNSMHQGLAMFDADHKLLVRNKRYLEIFGFPEEIAVEGATLEDITRFSVDRGTEADENALAERMAVADSRERSVYHPKLADGRVVEIIHEPLSNGGSLALYMDVTSRITAERSLQDHAAKLEASNRELQEFAYVAAHDLQEPLRKIEAFGDRLHRKCSDRLGEDGQRYIDRMQASSRRLRSLIDALLSYSRVTIKATPFTQLELGKLAEGIVSDLETSIENAEASIEIGPLPIIEGDDIQLRQLLMNLISNSLKFRKEGRALKVSITGEVVREPLTDGAVTDVCVLSFKDNGIGFDIKYADRIFTIFQRLHSRVDFEGTGIGLATCRKIVERHQGTIDCEGIPDHGATFKVRLPVTQYNRSETGRGPS